MALVSDKDGFLVGTPIAMDTTKFSRVAMVWRDIKNDTSAIRKSLAEGNKFTKETVKKAEAASRQPRANSVALPMRDARGRFVSNKVINAVPAKNRITKAPEKSSPEQYQQKKQEQENPNSVASPNRDKGGRFTKKPTDENPSPQDEQPKNPREKDGDNEGFFKRIAGDIASATRSGIAESAANTENIDPSIAAAKEAGSLVAPVLKPIGVIFRSAFGRNAERKKQRDAARENAKENYKLALPWYKKLAGMRDSKPVNAGEQAGGILGLLGGLLTPLLMSTMPLLLAGVAALAVGSLGAWIGTKIGGWINDKFGNEISMAFGAAADFIKENWTAALNPGGAIGSWIGKKFDDRFGTGKNGHSILSNMVDAGKSALGFGSAGNKKTYEDSLTAAGITNPTERAMYMAQAHQETGGFRDMEESFNYSPERLREVNKKARSLSAGDMSNLMKSGDSGIAEFMYGGRLGNEQAGDAYKYRGRGYIQLTGKSNYAEAGKALGIDLVGNPDLAADPAIASQISAWYYKTHNLSGAAKSGDVTAVTRGINGGTNGLYERNTLFNKYRQDAGILGSGTIDRSGAGATVSPSMYRAPSAGMAVPNIDKYSPGKAPELITPIGSRDKTVVNPQVTVQMPVTQNVGDRQIAQLATGGMGGTGQ